MDVFVTNDNFFSLLLESLDLLKVYVLRSYGLDEMKVIKSNFFNFKSIFV